MSSNYSEEDETTAALQPSLEGISHFGSYFQMQTTNAQSLMDWAKKTVCNFDRQVKSRGAGLAARLLVRPDWAAAQLGERQDGEMKLENPRRREYEKLNQRGLIKKRGWGEGKCQRKRGRKTLRSGACWPL